MAKISERWGLGKAQAELDFVDVEVGSDTALYLDPYALTSRQDTWSDRCSDLVTSFFDQVLDAIRSQKRQRAIDLLSRLTEPEETHLGVSRPGNKGRGIGPEQAARLYDAFSKSKASKTGIIQDLSDLALFIPQIGRDKISDITTNILRGPLIEYTQKQCALFGIGVQSVASGFTWIPEELRWRQDYVELPVVDGKKLILVPKYAVRYQVGVDHREYYDHFVLNFLQAEHLRAQDSLVSTLADGTTKVYKRDLRGAYPLTKEFLGDFSAQHPKVMEMYKDYLAKKASKVPDITPDSFDDGEFAAYLIERLSKIRPGNDDASRYHDWCIGVMSFLLFPFLINPEKEAEINEGRKRIDILYTNAMTQGTVFYRAATNRHFNANIVPVECKNYSKDPANPEFDQLIGRFSRERGRFGIMLFRSTKNRGDITARCRDAVRAGHGCILPMDDEFLCGLLQQVVDGKRRYLDQSVDALYRSVVS